MQRAIRTVKFASFGVSSLRNVLYSQGFTAGHTSVLVPQQHGTTAKKMGKYFY